MYAFCITCMTCGGDWSTENLAQPADLTDAQVLARATHSPDCPVGLAGTGTVTSSPRDGEPNTMMYVVTAVS